MVILPQHKRVSLFTGVLLSKKRRDRTSYARKGYETGVRRMGLMGLSRATFDYRKDRAP